METHRILAAALATAVISAPAYGDNALSLAANRTYYQTNAYNLRFTEGSLELYMYDGNFTYDTGCPLNGSAAFFPPSDIPPCEDGATGFVAAGDADNDGVLDDSSYWSVQTIVDSEFVEPSRPDLCELFAGPPSALPRPLQGFQDETDVVFYDIRTASVRQFDLTEYTLTRSYGAGAGELKRMNEEIVPGQYLFTFPRKDFPELTPVAFKVTVVPTLEALGSNTRSRRSGFRFTTGSWNQEYYQMDPRLITPIKWVGNDRTIIRAGDQIFFSILDPTESVLTFPPTVPQAPVRLTNATVRSYNLPPHFYVVGDEGVMNLQYDRLLRSSGVAYDTSDRDFRAKVIFVDTYNGYAQTVFPAGTSKRDRAAKGDFDRDGMINADEYAFQYPTNEHLNAVAKATYNEAPGAGEYYSLAQTSLVNNPITDATEQPAGPSAVTLDDENHIVFEVPTRPRVGTTVNYQFVELVPGRKGRLKPRKIKIEGNWTLTTRTESTTEQVTIRTRTVDPVFGTVTFAEGPLTITHDQEILVLRSLNPVDPGADLPQLGVKVNIGTLK